MKRLVEEMPPTGDLVAESSWMQITFTLDSAYYRMLWQRAEEEGVTVPGLVRETIVDALKGAQRSSTPAWASAE